MASSDYQPPPPILATEPAQVSSKVGVKKAHHSSLEGQTVSRYWAELNTNDFARLDPEKTVVILPLGAVEQHGPHLPLVVDTAIVNGVVARAMPHLEKESVLVLPTQSVGYSPEHMSFAGTLSLTAPTAIALWTELANTVAKTGFYKLLLLNAHGGNTALMDVVGREWRSRLGMLVYSANWWDLVAPEVWQTQVDADERRYGVHAGAVETAIMQVLAPNLVGQSQAQDFVSSAKRRDAHSTMLGRGISKMAWAIEDYHSSGAVGAANKATPEQGQALLDAASAGLAKLIVEIALLPWSKPKTS